MPGQTVKMQPAWSKACRLTLVAGDHLALFLMLMIIQINILLMFSCNVYGFLNKHFQISPQKEQHVREIRKNPQ